MLISERKNKYLSSKKVMSFRYHGKKFVYASLLASKKAQNIGICPKNAATFLLWETGTYSELLASF